MQTIEELNNEIVLVINNTESLYNAALEMTDFNTDNNQVSLLLAATFRKIRDNTAGDVDPYKIITSFPETKEFIVSVVKEIQEEAEA